MADKAAGEEYKFAVFCDAEGHDKPLILHDLTFARLIDEVIVPYEKGEPFFVDGASVSKQKCKKLKLLRQGEQFDTSFSGFHWELGNLDVKDSKILADQYHIRIEALFREHCEDVTSQILKAFNTEIKPKLSDYLPKRKELIDLAKTAFIESLKLLGGS